MAEKAATFLDGYLRQTEVMNAELARRLGVTPEAVRLWREGQRRILPEVAIRLEQALGVDRHYFRPDLWPVPTFPLPRPAKAAPPAPMDPSAESPPPAQQPKRSRSRQPSPAPAALACS